jgi:anionic cell wall polymer biosynthesis LytR-Cps2A-Psr (LCP) family protein
VALVKIFEVGTTETKFNAATSRFGRDMFNKTIDTFMKVNI